MSADEATSGRTVYFEFLPVGGAMKVTAIDSLTAIEVVVVGPVATPRPDLERLALRKLRNRLDREQPGNSFNLLKGLDISS